MRGGEECRGDEAAYDRADDWGNPEEPELTERPAAGEDRGAGAAGGVDRGVGDGDADEVDQREAEADGDGGKAYWGTLVGGTEDDQKEEGSEEHFDEEAGDQRVVFGGVFAVAIGGESAGEREGGVAAGDEVENRGGADGSEELGDDVGGKLGCGEALAGDETDRDGGVEMTAGDVSDGEGHGQERESEGEGDTDVTDTKGNGCCEDGAAATSEDKPKGAEELGCCTFREWHGDLLFPYSSLVSDSKDEITAVRGPQRMAEV